MTESASRHDPATAADLPLSPAWKLAGRAGQDPPRSALIGPWNGSDTGAAGGGTAAGGKAPVVGGGGLVAPLVEPLSTSLTRATSERWVDTAPRDVGRPVEVLPLRPQAGGKWRDEERETVKLDRWASSSLEDGAAQQRLRLGHDPRPDRGWGTPELTGVGRGRGLKPDTERWGPGGLSTAGSASLNKDWIPGLPGMGGEPTEKRVPDRWGDHHGANGGVSSGPPADRWRSPGAPPVPPEKARGFAIGRGRALHTAAAHPAAPGSSVPRWSATGSSNASEDLPMLGVGAARAGSLAPHAANSGNGAGSAGGGPYHDRKYTPHELKGIAQRLVTGASTLVLPAGASLPDHTDLKAPEGDGVRRALAAPAAGFHAAEDITTGSAASEQRRPLELLRAGSAATSGALAAPTQHKDSDSGGWAAAAGGGPASAQPVDAAGAVVRTDSNASAGNGAKLPGGPPPGMGGAPPGMAPPLLFSTSAHTADQWQYRDPQGIVQGPFTKHDILEWKAAGYFKDDLPMRAAEDAQGEGQWWPLGLVVRAWAEWERQLRAPPGLGLVPPPPPAAPPAPAPVQPTPVTPLGQRLGSLSLGEGSAQQPAGLLGGSSGVLQPAGSGMASQLGHAHSGADVLGPGVGGLSSGGWLGGAGAGSLQQPAGPGLGSLGSLLGGPGPFQAPGNNPLGPTPSLWDSGVHHHSRSLGGLGFMPEPRPEYGFAPVPAPPMPGPMLGGGGALWDGFGPALGPGLPGPLHGPGMQLPGLGGHGPDPRMMGHPSGANHQGTGLWGELPRHHDPALAAWQMDQQRLASAQHAQQQHAQQQQQAQLQAQQQQAQQQQVQAPLPEPPSPVAPHAPQPPQAPPTPRQAATPMQPPQPQPAAAGQAVAAAQEPFAPATPLIPPPQAAPQQVVTPQPAPAPAAFVNASPKRGKNGAPGSMPVAAPDPPTPAPVPAPAPAPAPATASATDEGSLSDVGGQASQQQRLAPWAAAATTKGGSRAKTLRQIQEEEAAAAAARAAEAAARAAEVAAPPLPPVIITPPTLASAPTAPPAGSAWVKPAITAQPSGDAASASSTLGRAASAGVVTAAAVAAAPAPGGKGKTAAQPPAASAAPQPVVGTGPGPRATTLAEIFDRKLAGGPPAPPPAWGGAAQRAAPVPSLRDVINFEECAADLEGGAAEEDVPELINAARAAAGLPPQPPAHRAASNSARGGGGGGSGDDQLFWDYTPAPPAPAAVQPKPASSPIRPPASQQPTLAARLAASAAATQPAAPAQAHGGKGGGISSSQSQRAARSPSPAPTAVAASNATSSPEPAGSPAGAFSPEFWAWCRSAWAGFGQQDLSLLEWMTTLSCRSEIADYINQVIGSQPGAGGFVAEFLKRKDAETARLANPGKKGKAKAATGAGSGGDWQAAAKAPAAAAPGKKAGGKVLGAQVGKGGRVNGFAVLGLH